MMTTVLRTDHRGGGWKWGQSKEVPARTSAAGDGVWVTVVAVEVVGSGQIWDFEITFQQIRRDM